MARRSIEDVMIDIEDFLANCKSAGFSSNKIAVPRDEFEDLFGELKNKVPAEIERCKKIMRNKEAILMNARKESDTILAEANITAQQLIAETTIVQQANQQAYDTLEAAKTQANEILANAVAEANEIRLGSMQYTNDIMMGLRNYIEATMNAEKANYENLLQVLNNEFITSNANLEEIQTQIIEFTGDPNSVTKAPTIKTVADEPVREEPKHRGSVAQRVRQAVGMKEEKQGKPAGSKPSVEIPDFISSGETVVPNETPLEVSAKPAETQKTSEYKTEAPQADALQDIIPQMEAPQTDALQNVMSQTDASQNVMPQMETSQMTMNLASEEAAAALDPIQGNLDEESGIVGSVGVAPSVYDNNADGGEKKVKKKIIRKRNPVIHTPQTAQEAVAKTVEAASQNITENAVYKANGVPAREVPPMEGNVRRGQRVGHKNPEDDKGTVEPSVSVGQIDDLTMDKKF